MLLVTLFSGEIRLNSVSVSSAVKWIRHWLMYSYTAVELLCQFFLHVAVSNTFIDNVVKWSSENSYWSKLLLYTITVQITLDLKVFLFDEVNGQVSAHGGHFIT